MRSRSAAQRNSTIAIHLILVPLAIVWLLPLWMMLVFSTMPDTGIFSPGINLIPSGEFINNFIQLHENTPFLRALLNSFVTATVFTVASVFLTSMAGWALARYEFLGKSAIWMIVLGTLALPYFVVVIPQFIMVARDFGLANTWFALIVPPLFNSLGVLFMRQAFLMMPNDLFDAARVDGVSEWRIYLFVAMPIAKPTIAALSIILFLASWNNYLWPLLINTQSEMMTAPVVLGSLFGLTVTSWGAVMVGAVLLTLPMVVMFVFLQRYFISGITSGAVK